MTATIPYEHKGIHRNDYRVDKARLEDFHALESDWREVFRWIMSVASVILRRGGNNGNEHLSDLWLNQVLTVLIELSQKNYDEYTSTFIDSSGTQCQDRYTDDLVKKVKEWIKRLETYQAAGYPGGNKSRSMRVAEELHRKLEDSLPVELPNRRMFRKPDLDDYSRPFFTMIGALSEIQSKFDRYFAEIEASGDMDASLALLLTFTRHYCRIIENFNQKFENLPDFYRHEILNAVVQEVIQDSAGVIIKPNADIADKAFSLPAGTRFTAGEDLSYILNEKCYVIPSLIGPAFTLFKRENTIVTSSVNIAGDNTAPLFDPDSPKNIPLEFGWAISSHILTLDEGERKITLIFALDNSEYIEELRNCAKSLFRLYVSGFDGWTEKPFDVGNESASSFTLNFTIDDGEESLALCNKDTHGMDSVYPSVRILVNKIPDMYDRISSLSFTDIYIKADVSGIHTFSLYGDAGEMDSSQPFYPFGTSGEKGSWFIFGSEELAMKRVLYVSLRGTWNKLPDGGYKQLYANYRTSESLTDSSFKVNCEWQENSRWNTCVNSPMPLFKVDHSGNAAEDAEFRFVLFEESPGRLHCSYPYTKKSKGFYRAKLSAPTIGFGMGTYRQQFAETMIHNSKTKENKQLPIPAMPQVPMLADVTIGYCAVARIKDGTTDDKLFRITETVGYEEYNLNNSIPLLPGMGSDYLLLELQKISEVKRLTLYFDIGYCNNGVSLGESGALLIESYNPLDKAWSFIPSERILREETIGLTRSGYIELNTINEERTPLFSTDQVWIRIGFEGNMVPRNIIVKGIYLNYFRTTANNGNGSSLPAGTITAVAEEDIRIVEIIQPNAGYGGKEAENSKSLSIRQSTRISTRNRAVNATDYERLLLERFTDMEKVCCIPVSGQNSEVRIVVFPKPQKRTLPRIPNWQLAEMEAYLKSYISPFVKFHVINPDYESLTITVTAILKDNVQDEGEVQRRLMRRIYKYFIPWFTAGELPTLNKYYSFEEVKSWLANDEGIEHFVSLEIEGGKSAVISNDNGEREDVYYYGSTECSVLYPSKLDIVLSHSGNGVGESSIGINFIIG